MIRHPETPRVQIMLVLSVKHVIPYDLNHIRKQPQVRDKTSHHQRRDAAGHGLKFFWLLAPPETAAGRINIEDCQALYQSCSVESISPLAAQVLPNSIWNSVSFPLVSTLGREEEGATTLCAEAGALHLLLLL